MSVKSNNDNNLLALGCIVIAGCGHPFWAVLIYLFLLINYYACL